MSDRQQHSVILAMERLSTSPLRASETNSNGRGILKTATDRSPPMSASAKFDTQVGDLSIRSQGTGDSGDTSDYMAAIAQVMTDRAPRLRSQRKSSTGDDETDAEDQRAGVNARESKTRRDQRRLRAEDLSVRRMKTRQPIGLVVALFDDGFVCRHINKENESVEGFAQPYDVESSYFLACIDNGRVPAGLPDMIACTHHRGSVLAEIRDYREMRTSLCPVSSAFLPAASALPLTDDLELDTACRVWQTLLKPSKSSSPIRAQIFPLMESQPLQSVFDHFPDVAPGELETLAVDAKRQLLQENDVLLSSSSTESSSPRGESHSFGVLPAESRNGANANTNDDADLTTTPITRSRFQSALEMSPPASLLSPIERKSAWSSFTTKIRQEDSSPTRCKRQIQTKVQDGQLNNHVDGRIPKDTERLKIVDTSESPEPSCDESQDEDMDEYELSSCSYNQDSQSEYSELVASDEAESIAPLPATQPFLSKLKGKRRRPENELLCGKPAWVTAAHVGRFFRAATRLEREHSRFLHVRATFTFSAVNAQRLMQAEKPPTETEQLSGSMRYLARQLGDLSRPSDVIAVARARKIKVAQDEGRQLRRRDWMEDGIRKEGPATVLISPDNEPVFQIHRIGTEENLLREHISPSRLVVSPTHEYRAAAAAPHFNTFDDDGNLQPQIA